VKDLYKKGKGKSIWIFKRLMPDVKFREVSLGEGITPLVKTDRLASTLGLKNLFTKDESKNPTSSFRDRAASVAVSHALGLGFDTINTATNGNMGASLAAYSSKVGMRCRIVVPKMVDLGKLTQMKVYGGEVISYGETIDDAVRYLKSRKFPGYTVIAEENHLVLEGQKTISFEIYLEMGVPDFIIVPVGSGSTYYSIWKGFDELKKAGIVDSSTKIIGVQSSGCAPIYWNLKGMGRKIKGTSALAIFVKKPPFMREVLEIVKRGFGEIVEVSDDDMIEAEKNIARSEGMFVELSSASTIAALKKLVDEGSIDKGDSVVCLITSSGLKSTYIFNAIVEGRKRGSITSKFNTKVSILRLLSLEPQYGYIIWKKIGRNIKFQAIYQHLKELESMGLIVSEVRGRRKYFSITERGRRVLEAVDELSLLL
ncbi:MAG: threonine synthase, partial [Candidatus Odinarchaeota archaeon]|nr:threonine synthase [Candidatus Odinarchaeota archaeon]